ncbi:MAG: roadblock/LC7 domain-containing protein [Alphaproteobacteria bacterium]|nr:roadblock/LC7 domain-containing protein [Alphaproteobacteria bacterium]
MSRVENITRALKALNTNTPDVEAAAVIDNDGLLIASAMPADIDDDSVAAMSAALLGLSERITSELERGEFELVMLRGADGYSVLVRCGPEAVLTVLAAKRAKLGLIFLDIMRSSKEIARLLG